MNIKNLIIDILSKLEKSNYVDPAEHIYDAIKNIKQHINDNDLQNYIHDFLWGLESETVIDVDGELKKLVN